MLAADGVFRSDGLFTVLPPVPREWLERSFRADVLALLVGEGAINEGLARTIRAWRHTGFSIHNGVRVRARDADGRRKLAQYMLRAPFSLEKMTYESRTGTVLYRSQMHKSLKRNFQLLPAAEWLELLCRHIPDRFEHLVRYAGWYSNRSRGKRAGAKGGPAVANVSDTAESELSRARSTWARLIHKVYEVDPLECCRDSSKRPDRQAASLIAVTWIQRQSPSTYAPGRLYAGEFGRFIATPISPARAPRASSRR